MRTALAFLLAASAAWAQNPYHVVSGHPRLLFNDTVQDTINPLVSRLAGVTTSAISGAAASDFLSLRDLQGVCPDRAGTVSTSGTTITWTGGSKFPACMSRGSTAPDPPLDAFSLITINGTQYHIGAHVSDTVLTATTSLPTLTDVAYTWQFDFSADGLSIFDNVSLQALIMDTLAYSVQYAIHHKNGNDSEADGFASALWRGLSKNAGGDNVPITSIAIDGSGVATVTLSEAFAGLADGSDIGIWGVSNDEACGWKSISHWIDSTHFQYLSSLRSVTFTEDYILASTSALQPSEHGESASGATAWAFMYDHCYDWLVANGHDEFVRRHMKASYWIHNPARNSSGVNQIVRESDIHNYMSWPLEAITTSGIALQGDDPAGDLMLATAAGWLWQGLTVQAVAGIAENYEFNVKKSVDSLTGGAFNWEGPVYWRNGSGNNLLRVIEEFDAGTNRYFDLWNTQFSTAANAAWYEIYSIMPDGHLANFGDTGSGTTPITGRTNLGIVILNDRFPDSHFKEYMDVTNADWNSGGYGQDCVAQKIIFYRYGQSTSTYDDLPLGRMFGPDIIIRNGWTSASTAVAYSSGFRGYYHRHDNAGDFSIVKTRPVVTSTSYTLDNPAYTDYVRRTAGANTLTIYDPTDCWKNYGFLCGVDAFDVPVVNDGGQFYNLRRSLPQFPTPGSADVFPGREILRNWGGAQYTNSSATVWGRVFNIAAPAFATAATYSAIRDDLTPNYVNAYSGWGDNPHVRVASNGGVIRYLLYLPATLGTVESVVTFDRVEATSSAFTKSWQIHTPGTPIVDGSTPTPGDQSYSSAAVAKVDNGTERMFLQPLLPAAPTLRVLGGDGCGAGPRAASCMWPFYVDQYGPEGSAAAHLWVSTWNYPDQPDYLLPMWKIFSRPSTAATTDYFLNVMNLTDTGVSSAPVASTITATGWRGAKIADDSGFYVAMFPTAASLQSSAAYAVSHSGTARHFVNGLAAGTVTIMQDASVLGTAVVDAAGAISFSETGGGSFTVSAGAVSTSATSMRGAATLRGATIH